PPTLKLAEGAITFEVDPLYERMHALMPVAGERYLLAATSEKRNTGKPTRLLWGVLGAKKALGEQHLPSGEVVVDYDPKTHRVLSYTDAFVNPAMQKEDGAILSVWEVLPTDRVATAVVRWKTECGYAGDEKWAGFVNGNLVVHRDSRAHVTAWDLT